MIRDAEYCTFRRPRMGAWIEMQLAGPAMGFSDVAPVWGRGLKSTTGLSTGDMYNGRPRMGAWIEIEIW